MSIVKEIAANIEAGKYKLVGGLVELALSEGVEPGVILNEGMISAMSSIGEKFKNNEIFVPEMLIAARAMKKGVEILKPYLVDQGVEPVGAVVIGTVAGDMHDIGKNLVCMMIEGAGFKVIDLGVDVPADKFVEALKENPDCEIVALSALLTSAMPSIASTIKAIEAAGLRGSVKIMIGGAPVTQAYADLVGADGYSEDAASAADLAKRLCGIA